MDKARSWFNRAVTLEPDVGDFWAQYYKFELQFGSPESQQQVLDRCAMAGAPPPGLRGACSALR